MNDLLTNLEKEEIFNLAYADDLAIVISSNNETGLESKLNKSLEINEGWCKLTSLSISCKKYQIVSIGKSDYKKRVLIGGELVE